MRRVPGAWVDQLDDLDDPEIRFGRRIQQRSLGTESDRRLYDVDAFVMRDGSLVITCWEAGNIVAKLFGDNTHAWSLTIPSKWKDRLLEILVFAARIGMPYGPDRDPLLLHLIADRFERSEHAALEIQDWLRANHVPFERG